MQSAVSDWCYIFPSQCTHVCFRRLFRCRY